MVEKMVMYGQTALPLSYGGDRYAYGYGLGEAFWALRCSVGTESVARVTPLVLSGLRLPWCCLATLFVMEWKATMHKKKKPKILYFREVESPSCE